MSPICSNEVIIKAQHKKRSFDTKKDQILSMCLAVSLPVSVSVHLSVHPSVHSSVHPSIHLACLPNCLPACQPACQTTCLSTWRYDLGEQCCMKATWRVRRARDETISPPSQEVDSLVLRHAEIRLDGRPRKWDVEKVLLRRWQKPASQTTQTVSN